MEDADLYHENNCLQKTMATEAFEKYGSKIKWKTHNNIIDLGCGEGTVTTALKKYFPSFATLTGCDINENMVKLANEHHCDEQTSFIKLDIAGNLPEKLRMNFSHVFSFYALQWVKDHECAFNNIYNLLEPHGECFLVFVTYCSIYEAYRSLACNKKWSNWVYDVERYISLYHDSQDPKTEVTKIMKNIGFDISLMKHEEVSYIFNDMEAMKRTLKAVNPFKIPSDKYDDFWEDYLMLWKKFEGLENKSSDFFKKDINFGFKVLIIRARKTKDTKKNLHDAGINKNKIQALLFLMVENAQDIKFAYAQDICGRSLQK